MQPFYFLGCQLCALPHALACRGFWGTSDSQSAPGWAAGWAGAHAESTGPPHKRTWGPAQSRECLRALRLRLDLGGVRCYCCGIFSAELAPEEGSEHSLARCPESGGAQERYLGLWPGAGRDARWPRAGTHGGGAGGNVPVFSLMNDVHVRGSGALSLARGPVE